MDKATIIYNGGYPFDFDTDNLVEIYDFSHCFTSEQLFEINKETQYNGLYFDWARAGGEGWAPEILNNLVIVFQLVQGLGTNLIYDLMKSSVLRLLSVIPKTKKPDIYIDYLGESITLDYGFDLTEEQKEKIVDVGIKLLIEKASQRKCI